MMLSVAAIGGSGGGGCYSGCSATDGCGTALASCCNEAASACCCGVRSAAVNVPAKSAVGAVSRPPMMLSTIRNVASHVVGRWKVYGNGGV